MSICDLIHCSVCTINKANSILQSSLLPVTYATCWECYNEQAEPKWIFNFLLEHQDIIKHEYIAVFKTYHEGEYISWADYAKTKEDKSNSNGAEVIQTAENKE